MENIIINNLSKSYGNKSVLKNINLEIDDSEIISVVGISGSGKSTLLKILCGIIDDFTGDIFYGNENITGTSIKDRKFIMMFQDFELFNHMTVFDNVAFGLKMQKVDKNEIKSEVIKYLKLVDLVEHKDKYPEELSGGQKQRVALIRSLIVKPRMLLLDEPFSSLDSQMRDNIRRETFKIIRELKIKTLFVTHDMREAAEVSDKIAILIEGQFEGFGTPEELYENPTKRSVAQFLYKENIFDDGLVKPKDIEIVEGDDYLIEEAMYHGMNYEYKLKGERELVVRDSKKRNVGDKVGVKIKAITKLED